MPFPRLPAVALVLLVPLAAPAADPTPEQAEFFESKVRPVLAEHCYRCHSGESKKEPKGGLRVDGRAHLLHGGDSGPSLVPGSPDKSKLIEAVRYANLDLQMPPKAKLPAAAIADLERWVEHGAYWPGDTAVAPAGRSEFDVQKRKAEHWAWQPVQTPPPPAVRDEKWVSDPVDRFILAKLEANGLKPSPPAEKLVWLRRVTFALTGLPPTPGEIAAFQKDESPDAFAKVADRLLASPAYGERWGRHWLDLVRYAESRGHESDPDIPNAHQYRDYVVRALNADVPYNRFVQEHIAGDRLTPRLDPKTGANESVIGTGFWLLGEEVHSPVDVRQDQADRLDNRIDVLTKAFLGLTVSCARCHDHKFDAIGTKDFYALYGVLEGSGYRQVRVDGWEQNRQVAEKLAELRARSVSREMQPGAPPSTAFQSWLSRAKVVVDYADLKPGEWLPDDVTFGPHPRPAGTTVVREVNDRPTLHVEPRTAAAFDRFWSELKTAPGTAGDHGELGKRPRAGFTIRTPTFTLERNNLYYLVRGGGSAYAAVCGHTVIHGPLHGKLVQGFADEADYRWVAHNLEAYKGLPLHAELTADPNTDFAVAMVVQADDPPPTLERPGQARPPAKPPLTLREVIRAEEELAAKVVWQSRLAPALLDGTGFDEHVFVRGNPRSPGEVVPRRSLEALAGPERIPHDTGSGRLELARQLTDPQQNPFVARVAVNRVWHHLFGRGLVASTDNFGVLGEPPTHPELLDHLASGFVRDGWSLRRLIRRLVLSSSYRMSSKPDAHADRVDATNQLLHHFRLKRLEGEAIRDAVLAVSGRLDRTVGGPSVPIRLTPFLDGRGRPGTSGPLDGDGRRSLYLAVRRNFLPPLLLTFDTPIPFSTVGRRQVSNVPAQSLILMNDPFIHQQAEVWANRVLKSPGRTDERVRGMYLTAFGRPPTEAEVSACRAFVAGKETDATAWTDLAHALFNVKEFMYVQ